MVLLLHLFACGDSRLALGDDTAAAPPAPAVALAGPAAIDPLYDASAAFTLTESGGDAASVDVRDATGTVVRVLAEGAVAADPLPWDGRDEAGAALPPGPYTVHAELTKAGHPVATTDASVEVVRVGVTAGTLGGDRIALCWHHAGGAGMYWDGGADTTTFSVAAIDTDGVATTLPTPWDDLDAPPVDPVGTNMPAAYAWDARPTLSLVIAGDVGDAVLTPQINGWTLTDGTVAPGNTVTFTADAPLAAGPGVVEETLALHWLAGDTLVGSEDIPLRIYALLGPPAFEEEGLPYEPWVAVIDPALRAIAGVEPTEAAVTSALVAYIYDELDLAYDTHWGASAYTEYDGNGYDNANFDLTSFLERGRGSIVNCTDCAAILEAHANMLGATLEYTILLPDFSLNYIKAIGGTQFSHCPFDNGGCGFSYHAVTTPDDGATIFDATLALDGDDDPSSYPSTDLLVQAIPGDEYLERLVMSGRVDYKHTQKETLQ